MLLIPTGNEDIRYSAKIGLKEEIEKTLPDKSYSNQIILTDSTPTILTTQKGVDNYRGRVGKTFFGDVFYDINLEVDQILPHTKSASEIKKSTSVNSLSQTSENVNNKFSEKIGKAECEK